MRTQGPLPHPDRRSKGDVMPCAVLENKEALWAMMCALRLSLIAFLRVIGDGERSIEVGDSWLDKTLSRHDARLLWFQASHILRGTVIKQHFPECTALSSVFS